MTIKKKKKQKKHLEYNIPAAIRTLREYMQNGENMQARTFLQCGTSAY